MLLRLAATSSSSFFSSSSSTTAATVFSSGLARAGRRLTHSCSRISGRSRVVTAREVPSHKWGAFGSPPRYTVNVASRATATVMSGGGAFTALLLGATATFSSASSSTTSAQAATDRATVAPKPASSIKDVDIVLYQYAICPFCNKVKAVLDFYGLPYRTVEVNPLQKREIQFSTEWRKVPIMTIDGEVVVDSPIILRRILDLLEERGVTADGMRIDEEQEYWMQWVDSSLAVLLFPNITRNFSESWQAFAYISDVESFAWHERAMNRFVGPVAMWAAQGKIKAKYGIDDEREAVTGALAKWMDAVGDQPYLGGQHPSLADLCIFGCIRSISGLDTHSNIMEDQRLESWYGRVAEQVGDSTCTGAARQVPSD